jgi:uncharacterized protein with PIN domain
MFRLRCFKCGWSISLNRAELEAAVAEADAKGENHHVIICPKCRRANKVSVRQMRGKLPRRPQPAPEPTEPAEGQA